MHRTHLGDKSFGNSTVVAKLATDYLLNRELANNLNVARSSYRNKQTFLSRSIDTMQHHPIRWTITFCLFAVVMTQPATVLGQLRVVTYNTTPTNDVSRLRRVLSEIGNENVNGISRPIDILALQEQGSQEFETQQVLDILNELYGESIYARCTVNGAGFFTQGVVYRTDTVELLDEVRVGTTSSSSSTVSVR